MKSEGPAEANGCLNLKPRLFYAAVALCLYFIVFGFTYSLFSLIILQRTGNDYGLASTYTGAYSAITNLATFLFSPLIGVMADRYGRKPFIALSMAAVAFDCFSVITAPYLWILIVTKFIFGSCTSMFTSAYAYAADVSTPERLAKDFGTLGIAFGVAFAFSPVLAGWLGNRYTLIFPYYIGFCVAIVGLLYSLLILPESKKKEKVPFDKSRLNPLRSFYLLKKNKITLFMSLIFFLLNFGEQAMIDTLMLYVKWRFDWDAFSIGIMSSIFGICYMFAQGVVVRVAIPLLKERKTIMCGIFINAITIFPYGLATASWQIYLLYVVRSFGLIALPTARAYICKHFESSQQGEVAGVLAGLQTLSSFIGPFLYNTMFTYLVSPDSVVGQMPQLIFFVTSVFFLVTLGATMLLFRIIPDEVEIKLKSPKIVRINGDDDEEERLLGSV